MVHLEPDGCMLLGKRVWSLVVLGAATSTLTLSAQPPKPSFAVASVKSALGQRIPPMPSVFPGGRFYRPGEPVAGLITFAYGVMPFQVIGGPQWIRNDPFEIDARAEGEASPQQIALMLQSLLEDRFRLVVRTEQRVMEHSVLVMARGNGSLGPGLAKCADPQTEPPPKPVRVPRGAYPITGTCRPASSIAASAAYTLAVPVLDKTGLAGLWNYQILFSAPPGAGAGPSPLPEVSDAPPFRIALEEQLGLKLQTARGPVEVLVVESVRRPGEN